MRSGPPIACFVAATAIVLSIVFIRWTSRAPIPGAGGAPDNPAQYGPRTADGASPRPAARAVARGVGATRADGAGAPGAVPPRGDPAPSTGQSPPVRIAEHPEAASVAEALRTSRHPERVSVHFLPKEPFNRPAFESDPERYLQGIEPGRVFTTAPPGPGVPPLKAAGETFMRLRTKQSVTLRVVGEPGAPVTFTAFDLGSFAENRLNSVTVRADAQGKAAATFVATPGAVDTCRVLAGSPLSSGQVKFVVDIVP
jgi:hypothetical protein